METTDVKDKDLKSIRIDDPYIVASVDAERIRRCDGSAAKTAARLISERLAQLELIREANSPRLDAASCGSGA